QMLELTVSVAHTEGELAVMLTEDQGQIGPPGQTHPGRIGIDLHTLPYHVVAAGDEVLLPVHLDAADAAGADLVDLLEVAEMRDLDAGSGGGFQNGCALRYGDRGAVDVQIYHLIFLPPLNTPKPKWSQRRQRPHSCWTSSSLMPWLT